MWAVALVAVIYTVAGWDAAILTATVMLAIVAIGLVLEQR
jgi:hypothetical protein